MHLRLVIALCLFAICAFAQTAKPLFTLKVIVKDSITKIALEDATVLLTKHSHAHLTNTKGIAIFDTLRAGHYHLSCSFIGYHSYENTLELLDEEVVTILLCPQKYHLHEVNIEQLSTQEIGTYSTQSTAILNATQIEKMRGQNLGELLKNIAGVTTLNSGPGIAKPVIRGLHSNRLVMLNNGVRQEGQQWGSEHAPEIDPFSVNKVEVIKGAASVEFGPEAIGGVIRLSPRNYPNTNGINGEVSLQGFSNNKQGASSAMLEGAHFKQQQLNWRVQGTLRKAGDSRAPNYVISNTGFNEQNGNVSIGFNHKQIRVDVFASVFNSTIGIMRAAHIGSSTDLKRAIASSEPLIINPFTHNINRPFQQVRHQTQSVKLSYQFKTAGKLWLQISRQLNSRQEYDLGVSWNPQSATHQKPAYDLTLTTFTYDAVFEHKKWKNITGKIGISLMSQYNFTGGIQKPIIPNFIAYTQGVFILEKWAKGRWTAEAGTRIDRRTQTIYYRNYINNIAEQERAFNGATFIMGGSYSLTETLKISSTISSAWRPPAINELYSYGLHNGTATFEIGDSNLTPEKSYNFDVTIKHQTQKWTAELSLFRNQINAFIYQLPTAAPTITLRGTFPTFMFVQTNVIMKGAEFGTSYLVHKHVILNAAISYLHAQDVSNNKPLIFMPANRSRIGLNYQHNQVWKLENLYAEIAWQYVAEQSRFVENLDYKNPPPAYHLMDVNMGFEIPYRKQHIRISASVKNVFNVSYRDYLNRFRYFTDEPGRNFIIRLTIPFQLFSKH